jgi:cobalt-zinc-cadmium efflux system protein
MDRCEVGKQSCLPSQNHGDPEEPLRPGVDCDLGGDHGHHHESGHAHGHSHGSLRSHADTRALDRKRLLLALGLAAVVFIAELVGGLASGSLALVSDAGHVLADMSGLLISLLALFFAARPATKRRTFGYHRLEILAAMVNGVILVALAAIVVYEAIHRIGAPTDVRSGIMLPVAAAGLVTNLIAAWFLHGSHSLNARSAYLHVLSDALSSMAVVIGGALIAFDKRLVAIDPILGLVIAGIVVFGAFRLLREAVDILLEAVPRDVDLEEVRSCVQGVPGIVDVHDLHIWTITSGFFALSAHVVVEDVGACDDLLRRVKDRLKRDHRIGHSTIQIESTGYDRLD